MPSTLRGTLSVKKMADSFQALSTQEPAALHCAHCSSLIPYSRFQLKEGTPAFCCRGCQTVYQVIQAAGLGRYYEFGFSALKQADQPQAEEELLLLYSSFDLPHWREQHGVVAAHPQLSFYLEGVHCTACLWLLEKLGDLCDEVAEVRMDLERSTLRLTLKPHKNFAPACALLARLGYRPHLLENQNAHALLAAKENWTQVTRIAVAGACAANVMLMSVALYAGADGTLAQVFRVLMVILSLPAYFYSATPFYRSAWAAIQTRSLSIDVPIVFALWAGLLAGIQQAALRSNEIYLDSLVGLIFLLLGSRYFLRRLSLAQLQGAGFLNQFTPSVVKLYDQKTHLCSALSSAQIQLEQWIQVEPGEIFPVDGFVVRGKSKMNNALLSGESEPISVSLNDSVFAGAKNLEQTVLVQVTTVPQDSKISKLAQQLRDLEGSLSKNKMTTLTDLAARYFVGIVLGLGFALFSWFALQGAASEGFRRAMSLIIIACPCGLALATPLTYTRAHQWAAKFGILLKDGELLERIPGLTDLVLDKTGTLTQGKPTLVQIELAPHFEKELGTSEALATVKSVAYTLEKRSHHPIARAILQELAADPTVREFMVTDFKDLPGIGVTGTIHAAGAPHEHDTAFFELKREKNGVGLFKNGQLLATFILKDALRPDSIQAIALIKKTMPHVAIHLLSGDHTKPVEQAAHTLNILSYQAQVTPQDKFNFISSLQAAGKKVMMVGDGANDTLALKSADIGVAAHGGLDVAVKAADVFMSHPGVTKLASLLVVGIETKKVLLRNFGFSLAYNVLGGTAALLGWINPLGAAILMPLSALTVFISTQYGTKKMRNLI